MCSMAESMLGSFVRRDAEHVGDDFFSGECGKGERADKLLGARVMMTCTRMPRSCSRRTISAAL